MRPLRIPVAFAVATSGAVSTSPEDSPRRLAGDCSFIGNLERRRARVLAAPPRTPLPVAHAQSMSLVYYESGLLLFATPRPAFFITSSLVCRHVWLA